MAKETITITDFSARLTLHRYGDMTSGNADYNGTFGVDPFTDPTALRFLDKPVAIGGAVVTDLIVAGKPRLESTTTYVYAIGSLGRLYKIQVNNGSANPDYDTPVLITTLATKPDGVNVATYQFGSSMEIATDGVDGLEKLYIGHDQGVTKIKFDGTGETYIGVLSTTQWITNTPRISAQANGNIYYTNGSNIATLSLSTSTVTNYNQLAPAFPSSFTARDIDAASDGTYIAIVISRGAIPSLLASPNQTLNTSTDSALVTWNGTDTGYNQFYDFSDFVTSAHQQVGQNDYMLGYDTFGACIYNGVSKVRSLPNTRAPAPSATFQNGNMLYFMGNDFDAVTGKTFASLYVYGRFDEETDPGLFRLVRDNCGSNGSIVSIPWCVPVTNQFGGSSFAYKSRAKVYFSAFDGTNYFLMSQNIGTAKGTAPSTNASYYTQSHKWKSRKSITEVRVYVDDSYPGANATGNISLYKLSGNTIGNVAQLVYTINKNVDYAHDFGRATVQAGPVYEAQLRIFAPSDITGFVIRKVEVDVIDSPA